MYDDPSWPFIIETDASHDGLGAILLQADENGVKWPITYASRSLSDDEIKWDTREQEALAVIWAAENFRPFVQGR